MKKIIFCIAVALCAAVSFAQTITVTNSSDFTTVEQGEVVMLDVTWAALPVPASGSGLIVFGTEILPAGTQTGFTANIPIDAMNAAGGMMTVPYTIPDVGLTMAGESTSATILVFEDFTGGFIGGNFLTTIMFPGTPPPPTPSITVTNSSDFTTVEQGEVVMLDVTWAALPVPASGSGLIVFGTEILPAGTQTGFTANIPIDAMNAAGGMMTVPYTIPDVGLTMVGDSTGATILVFEDFTGSFIGGNFTTTINFPATPPAIPSITLDNAAALGTTFTQGEEVTLEVSYENLTSNIITIQTNLFPASATLGGPFGSISQNVTTGTSGNFSISYTIDENTPTTVEATAESTAVFLEIFAGVNFEANANQSVTINSNSVLSTPDFNEKETKVLSYDSEGDIATFGSVGDYKVFSLSGAEVLSVSNTSTINMSSLTDGLYFVTSALGTAKIAKY